MITFEYDEPHHQGMNTQLIDSYANQLMKMNTKALLIMRNNKLIKECYSDDYGPEIPHYTASLAKTIVGGLALAVAVTEGYIAYQDLACTYIPSWQRDPLKSKITIRHLATHTSGLEDTSALDTELSGWKRMFWQKEPSPSALDPITCSLEKAQMMHPPGTKFLYSNPGFGALSYAITVSLQQSPYPNIQALLQEKIFNPLGIPDSEWHIGYNKPFQYNGLDVYGTWGGGEFSPRAILQIARLYLQKGQWGDQTLLNAHVLKPMMAANFHSITQEGFPQGDLLTSSICGFSNHCAIFPNIPDCMFLGAGAGHQVMMVIPSLELIVVRLGNRMIEGKNALFWSEIKEWICDPIQEMLQHQSPFPASEKVRHVTFEPADRIRISGEDSDNWPCTWANDGGLYTSYGDGYGFLPHTEKKLSLGFAEIIGTPQSFEGVNLRTETGEREGDGSSGEKASGLLMVDGVMYMLARNAGNSQLAWSADMGRTWEWGFKFETSFGCPTFVNYGQNYAGAPDDYVYIYSPHGTSAYEEYDHIVLARVNRYQLKHLTEYEYFKGIDDSGTPIWTPLISEMKPVFTFPNHCHRLEAIYHAATQRYWLVSACNHEGGWGIFDSPTPYGPWSTVYFTEYWGLGKTHAYRFPTKWISEDGTQLHLVFSGRRFKSIDYDAMCVRSMTLELID
ncbi:serine hydrolase [Paenibacillus qinlingensis]|uniref:CubicO group peptidase (Beta-lactamase class C family) n=1 Tax=Paenibacillus qinlingensis TaxID=1837343 RepID=A0ABU1NRG8_9BACL|nr:serine hydrolase [Paenibacillus qinlingensis]MDR6550076.1 CubicO group peptidase (beta-lactamase class C family) [Paenibacillus qinlingensis]